LIQTTTFHYVGFARRALAAILDTVLLTVVIGFLHLLIFGDSGVRIMASDTSVQIEATAFDWVDDILYLIVAVMMWVRYCATPGKLILGCYVVDANTFQPIGYRKALIRYLGYFVSLLPLGLGFLWVLWDKRKQGFHDKMAKTVVISETPLEHDDESQKSLNQILAEIR